MPSCSNCSAPVIWARTETGKPFPMDPGARDDYGNIARQGRLLPDGCLLVVVLKKGHTHPDPHRFVSHFATCPNATKHRKAPKR